ncbi:TetR/AcrR family transcriptional regulator [Desulfosoma caldarium]|uniref:TetR family transcriptional regulator n=1 Tax=Desulfosoma caldarium TaxID=610254 RepID=A0A3N1UJ81_9BACT|nr:CerR family C-terminal domain-containing protein [Desulfosoma caldarium]ROQ89828.1 TetR family transcriptional regulator [Desulfosoma caldarium]
MALRRDGLATRTRLLEAACEVFAEKGYRGARLVDICRRAGANIAAVNYHFGDKASLYVQAWKHAFRKDLKEGPVVSEHVPPRERFAALIRDLLINFVKKSRHGQFTRLYFQELANPTGLIRDALQELIEPHRLFLLKLLSDLTGLPTNDERLLFSELSIINQCRAVFTVRPEDLEYLLGQPISQDLIDRLAEHIIRFSLGGLRAVTPCLAVDEEEDAPRPS